MQVNDNQFIKINSEESVYLTHKKNLRHFTLFRQGVVTHFQEKRERFILWESKIQKMK